MPPARSRTRLALALTAGWSLLVLLAWRDGAGEELVRSAFDALRRALGSRFGTLGWDLGEMMLMASFAGARLLALAVPFMAALVALIRSIARAVHRATGRDGLTRLRDLLARRPRAAWLASAAPGLLVPAAAVVVAALSPGRWDGRTYALATALLAAALVPVALSALFVRGFLHLLAGPFAPLTPEETSADGYTFAAVAVTREARAVVGVAAGVSLAVMAVLLVPPGHELDAPAYHALLAGYAASMVAGALAYRRASRIAIGLDGVAVTAWWRRRFFAYRDLDGAVVSPSREILLERGGRTVLRLQLHGKDTVRRDAIAARIEAGIARARQPGAAHRLAESATASHLAGAASGETDYRRAGASREELWEVLEAPAADAGARTRAAAALSRGCDGDDRRRLRVAAERCAEPGTRTALLRVAEDAAGEADEPEPARAPVAVMSVPRP